MLGLYRPDANALKNPLFRFHFLQKLPTYVRDQVVALDSCELRDLAKTADKIVAQRPPSATFAVDDEDPDVVSALQRTTAAKKRHSGAGAQTTRVCRFHSKFGEQAKNCLMPCSWNGKVASAQGNVAAGRQ